MKLGEAFANAKPAKVKPAASHIKLQDGRKVRTEKTLEEGAKPANQRVLAYVEILEFKATELIGNREVEVTLGKEGRVTLHLSWARRNFKTFEKIHAHIDLINDKGAEIMARVTPIGCKLTKNGEISITNRDSDKLAPRWMRL